MDARMKAAIERPRSSAAAIIKDKRTRRNRSRAAKRSNAIKDQGDSMKRNEIREGQLLWHTNSTKYADEDNYAFGSGDAVVVPSEDRYYLRSRDYVQRVDGVGPLWQGICLKPHPDGYTAVLDRTRAGAALTVQDWHRGIYA